MRKSGDVTFRPKVWQDTVHAYFDQKLGLGTLAKIDKTLTAAPGETVNFPYWKKLSAVEEPAEDDSLSVDKLTDDSFSVTIKEVGKAVGWTDKSKRVSAHSHTNETEDEAQKQLGQLYAEKVENDLISILSADNRFKAGTVGTTAAGKMNIRDLLVSKVICFGDKALEAKAVVMHSLDYANMLSDSTAGFLHANATMPMFGRPGFMGQILDMDLFVLDSVPQATDIDGKKAWHHFFLKQDAFGVYLAEELNLEKDRDILARQNVVASTMWYGVLNLHARIASTDYRIGRGAFSSGVNA